MEKVNIIATTTDAVTTAFITHWGQLLIVLLFAIIVIPLFLFLAMKKNSRKEGVKSVQTDTEDTENRMLNGTVKPKKIWTFLKYILWFGIIFAILWFAFQLVFSLVGKTQSTLSGIEEYRKVCFQVGSEKKCSYQGSDYIATIEEYIPGEVLRFEVCWKYGCSVYTSAQGSSSKGTYYNEVIHSRGIWEIPNIEGEHVEGISIDTKTGEEFTLSFRHF